MQLPGVVSNRQGITLQRRVIVILNVRVIGAIV